MIRKTFSGAYCIIMCCPEYRLKQMPTDVWSVREKLALASSVMRSGDQNWYVSLQYLLVLVLLMLSLER